MTTAVLNIRWHCFGWPTESNCGRLGDKQDVNTDMGSPIYPGFLEPKNMKKLVHDDLYSLEEYADKRAEFRAKVIAHKRNRKVAIGDHATLYFEDRLTMQYQVQEMLRVERIFERSGIQEELDAYNPLIPDGNNFKATFMIEYAEVEERRAALAKFIGIEDKVWVAADGIEPVYAIADEDLERETEDKTSSVHFLRFELNEEMTAAIGQGFNFGFGIDHPEYKHANYPLAKDIQRSLAADLDIVNGERQR